MRKIYNFYLFVTTVLAMLFVKYILDSQILPVMDFGGWAFYLTSCVSHAACIAVLPFVIQSLFHVCRLQRVGNTLAILLGVVLSALVYVNEQVYQIYRFHINGFVLNMITGPAAGEIFNFDTMLYVKYAFMIALVTVFFVTGWLWCSSDSFRKKLLKTERKFHTVAWGLGIIIGSTLFAHGYHIVAAFYEKESVLLSERLLPYYFPTTSYSLLTDTFGCIPPEHTDINIGSGDGQMTYPIKPLQIEALPKDSVRPNIVVLLIDSWNVRALTAECMPNIWNYAQENLWFTNHVSCSNGTKSSVFGIWYGISSYYWNLAEAQHVAPAILDVARQEGYTFHNYPSASQLDPPFGRVLFAKEKNVRIDTKGKTVRERDGRIAADFVKDLPELAKAKSPFISFLFFDLPHSFEMAEDMEVFKPTWKYADYSKLDNDTDPTPFWNLYRNTCHEVDKFAASVLTALRDNHLEDNTIVIVSGDHSQEFNENKKNFWGHNGNFSKAQIAIPLIMHIPNAKPVRYAHRTTHYDITPTLMKRYMGVTNDVSDYSMGYDLFDTCKRDWHIVGSELNYGFIISGDTILEKTPQGGLSVFDERMNMVGDYHLKPSDMKVASDKLNRFIK